MDVKINGGFADLFIDFNSTTNTFVVRQDKLSADFIGSYQIKVTATYKGPKNIFKMSASFILRIEP